MSFASFEYLCYGSTAIINILLLQCGDRLKSPESDVYGRQNRFSPKIEKNSYLAVTSVENEGKICKVVDNAHRRVATKCCVKNGTCTVEDVNMLPPDVGFTLGQRRLSMDPLADRGFNPLTAGAAYIRGFFY